MEGLQLKYDDGIAVGSVLGEPDGFTVVITDGAELGSMDGQSLGSMEGL